MQGPFGEALYLYDSIWVLLSTAFLVSNRPDRRCMFVPAQGAYAELGEVAFGFAFFTIMHHDMSNSIRDGRGVQCQCVGAGVQAQEFSVMVYRCCIGASCLSSLATRGESSQ